MTCHYGDKRICPKTQDEQWMSEKEGGRKRGGRGQEGIAFIRYMVAWQMLVWASKALWQPPAESTVLLMCPGMPAP